MKNLKKILLTALLALTIFVPQPSKAQEEIEGVEVICKKTISFVLFGVHYDYWECNNEVSFGWDIY